MPGQERSVRRCKKMFALGRESIQQREVGGNSGERNRRAVKYLPVVRQEKLFHHPRSGQEGGEQPKADILRKERRSL